MRSILALVAVVSAAGLCAVRPAPADEIPPDEPLAEVVAADVAHPDPVPDDATLEAGHAVIGTITIRAVDLFDTENPKESGWIFRTADKLHIKTKEGTIRKQLTFREGDPYSRAALDESERMLRHCGYLYEATITPVRYDGERVDVQVITRDVWTLRAGVGYGRSGGVNKTHIGLHDANFLGFGKDVELNRVSSVDRTETIASYTDPALGGTHMKLDLGYSANSDGDAKLFTIERPFWRRSERWAAGVTAEDTTRTDTMYALGTIVDHFDEQKTFAEGYVGRALGDPGRTVKRILFGATYDRSLFDPVAPPRVTAHLPPDRTLSYPWVEFRLLKDGYLKARDMDNIGRVEDLNLGLELHVRLGAALPSFGSDRTAAIVAEGISGGFSPGPAQIISLGLEHSGRVSGPGLEDSLVTGTGRYYKRFGDHALFYMALTGADVVRQDPDHQLLLGGDSGLRGYPLRYAVGTRSLLLTLEQRVFFDHEMMHLFRLGAVGFVDVGKAWGGNLGPASKLGDLKDVGIGLRIAQTRSAHAGIIRIDVAMPFDAMPGADHIQVVVTTGTTF